MPIEVSAPGKLFLIGEYAVLEGAPALLTAVDRRARVRLTAAPDLDWRISAPNLDLIDIRLGPDGDLPTTLDATTRARLGVFDAVRTAIARRLRKPLDPLAVTIDTSDFAQGGHKLGLGSSAAVSAALAQALAVAADIELSRAELAALAIEAHRAAQGGTGSGGDVAASIYGGFIHYVRGEEPVPLAWPGTLCGLTVVTGTGARTVDMVERVRAYARTDPYGYDADMTRLCHLADTAPQALARGTRLLQLAKEYFEALMALDHHARAGIISRRHDELHALATRHNGVFKTSGAGGGDVGLVFVRRGQDEAALRDAFAHVGAEIVALTFGAPGVCIEQGAP